jgi:hypothetical protein
VAILKGFVKDEKTIIQAHKDACRVRGIADIVNEIEKQ